MSINTAINGPNNTDERIDPASLDAVYDLAATTTSLGEMVREAIGVIDRGLDVHGLAKLSISFNGGKDCTVLLHLLAAVLRRRTLEGIGYGPVRKGDEHVLADGAVVSPARSNTTLHSELPPLARIKPSPEISLSRSILSHVAGINSVPELPIHPPIPSVYVLCPSPFDAVDEFVEATTKAYDLRLVRVSGSMQAALQAYLDTPEGSQVDAILVGTRRNDPHGAKLGFLQHCDPGWPQLLRVHPIINWSYANVWDYLRHPALKVPYCRLYDEGYTSLGSTFNSFKNPALQVLRPGLPPTWQPAYMLEDGSLERAGRGNGAGLERRSAGEVPVATAVTPGCNSDIVKAVKGEVEPTRLDKVNGATIAT